MKFKLEFCPNPDMIVIHFRMRLSTKIVMFRSPLHKMEVWKGDEMIEQEPPTYIKRLWEVPGIRGITIDQYDISLEKGDAFDWNEMLEQIITILNLELFPDSEPEQLGAPKRPSPELLEALRRQGCDV